MIVVVLFLCCLMLDLCYIFIYSIFPILDSKKALRLSNVSI